jgi:prepilin-type N-terminal cleavage/methylation domain-containing protein
MKQSKAFSLIELSIVILVIGILIAGVTQASNMIYEFSLAAAKNLTKTSGIESIKDMTLWLDATRANSDSSLINSNGKTDISNNDRIKTWSDANPRRSRAELSFTRTPFSTDITKYHPVYIKNGLNGLPSIKFDGEYNCLEGLTSFGEIFKTNELTMFFVLIMKGPFGVNQRFLTMNTTDTSRINVWFGPWDNSTFLSTDYRGKDETTYTNNSFNLSSQFPNFDKFPILLSIRLQTNGRLSAKFNGKSLTAIATRQISGQLELGKTLTIHMGWPYGIEDNPQFYLSEMIFYNSGLKNEEILYVEKYLSKKWGIALK